MVFIFGEFHIWVAKHNFLFFCFFSKNKEKKERNLDEIYMLNNWQSFNKIYAL